MPDWRAELERAFAARQRLPDPDVMQELAQHAEAEFEADLAGGRTEQEARARVERLIDDWAADPVVAARRSRRPSAISPPPAGSGWWVGVGSDLRYAVRLLGRQRGFSFITIATMALGIAAMTTLFSVAYGVLIKPLPWPDADRLVRVTETREGHAPRVRGTISNATFNAWYEDHRTLDSIGGFLIEPASAIVAGRDATRVITTSVTPSLFTVLRARPLRGRIFVEDDGRPGGNFPSRRVIVLSYGLWQEWFGGRDDALGRTVQLGERAYTVVGVMPPEFVFPSRDTRAWTPWGVGSVIGPGGERRVMIFGALARLEPGVTPAQAAAEGTARAKTAPDPGLAAVAMFGGAGAAQITAIPAMEMMTAEVKPAIVVMLAAVVLLFVIATANIVGLQVGRATTRQREMAIRAAIGAGGARLIRQLVVENALIGVIGGACGLALTALGHRALPSLLPADFPRAADVAIDVRVMLFAVGSALVAGITCGLFPGLHARRLGLADALATDGQAPTGGSFRSPARLRGVIMTAQIAITCLLLVGGALLTRSFTALLHADRGYDPRNLATASLPLPPGYSLERRVATLESISERLERVPGVLDAAFGNALPLLSSGGFRAFKMRSPDDPSVLIDVSAMQHVVSARYFHALGLRVIAGRPLLHDDTWTAPNVIVVNRSFAERYLGSHPVGAVVPDLGMCRDRDQWEVVGIVDDMRQGGVLSDEPQPEVFMSYRQVGCPAALSTAILVVRTRDNPAPMAAALRQIVREQSPTLALDSVMTMEDRMVMTLAKPRLYAVVVVTFALLASTIAGVGLFGLLSQMVTQRSRELGLRAALGAQPADIIRLVLRQMSVIAIAGISTGLLAAFVAVSSLATVLYGVRPRDPLTFAVVPLLLALVVIVAAVVPARRASRVDPLSVLRG